MLKNSFNHYDFSPLSQTNVWMKKTVIHNSDVSWTLTVSSLSKPTYATICAELIRDGLP